MILGQSHIFLAQVDFDLLDAGNVVYHPNYFILCERARNAALAQAGYGFDRLWAEHSALAVLACTAKFSRALVLNQEVMIITETLRASGSRLDVRQRLCDRGSNAADVRAGYRATAPDLVPEGVAFEVEFSLGFVNLHPLKAGRLPAALVSSLRLRPLPNA